MCLLTFAGRIEVYFTNFLTEETGPSSKLLNEGLAFHQIGRLEDASGNYQLILEAQPQHSIALYLLGIISHQIGDIETALHLIERAIKYNPNESVFYNSCGDMYRELDKYDLAISHYEQALSIDPSLSIAHFNLGVILHEVGRLEDALAHYEQAFLINPCFPEAHNNLGAVLYELDRLGDAFACYENALIRNPYFAEAHNNIGIILKALGKPIEAITHHQVAIRMRPKDSLYYITFIESLSDLQITQINDSFKEDLIATLSLKELNHQSLAFAGASIIKHSFEFQKLAAFIECTIGEFTFQKLLNTGLEKILLDPIFLALLKKTIIRDSLIESILTRIRSALLHMVIETKIPNSEEARVSAFIYALSCQCFFNEYVYFVSERESIELNVLKRLIPRNAENIFEHEKIQIAILACYIPLYELRQDEVFLALIQKNMDEEIVELVTRQIIEINEEKLLRNKIENIGIVEDIISKKVRMQYEENPYPRWLNTNKPRRKSVRYAIRKLFPHLPIEQISENSVPDILIAGCGTGQQAINRALEFQSSQVLGIDISLASLSYAKRKAIALRINNVEFKQVDLLNLHLLRKSFDIIECVGVLHHMSNPEKGWHNLVKLLKPGALMRIGLYSKVARKDISDTQIFIAKKGFATNPAGIRESRKSMFAMTDNSNINKITRITDFYTLSETRDLLFHVKENQFTILQIAEIIDRLGLNFLGFEFNNTFQRKKYLAQFANDLTATSLQNWHKYELQNTETFIGLYLFWVQKCSL